eukprot:2714486-Amphidinium_carterae.1
MVLVTSSGDLSFGHPIVSYGVRNKSQCGTEGYCGNSSKVGCSLASDASYTYSFSESRLLQNTRDGMQIQFLGLGPNIL